MQKMQLENDEAQNILVGGVDELVKHHVNSHRLIGHVKAEPADSTRLLESNTRGSVMGEGANFFILSNQKQAFTYAEIVAVECYNTLSKEQLPKKIKSFLTDNQISISAVDLVISGNNGDVDFDGYYENLSDSLFKDTPQAYYKHLSAEFDTATGFAFWLASKILKTQTVPEVVKLNTLETKNTRTILIYNQYRGENHSLVLLRKC